MADAVRHYTVITGTGRAGTTLLVRILTVAGLDTGFDPRNLTVDPLAHAGLEGDIRRRPPRAIVKSPWIATYIEDVLERDDIAIDHAIICVRDLHGAAESRRRIQQLHGVSGLVPGGLWGTRNPDEQEAALAELFYRLLYHLTKADIPLTFLHFPRFANDAAYLVDKLTGVFPAADPDRLLAAFRSQVQPDLITGF